MSKQCPTCGGDMHRQSKMCRDCYKKSKIKPLSYIQKTCPICNKYFTVHIAQIARGQGIYCSRSCARSGSPVRKKTRKLVKCTTCGNEFEKHLSEIKKNTGDLNFCSPECWYGYNQGENHYGWEGGQNERVNHEYLKWRKAVLNRDHSVCRICHSTQNLEVHHIHRFATYPDLRWNLENGISLCHECHVKFRHHEEEYTDILKFISSVPVVELYV